MTEGKYLQRLSNKIVVEKLGSLIPKCSCFRALFFLFLTEIHYEISKLSHRLFISLKIQCQHTFSNALISNVGIV